MPLFMDFFAVLKLNDGEGLGGQFYLFSPITWETSTVFFNEFALAASSRAYESNND